MNFPVSIKGVLLEGDKVILLKNERREWELPGGRLEVQESPQECLRREVREELNLEAEVGPLLDAWVYEVLKDSYVLILIYGCFAESLEGIVHSREHSGLGLFRINNLDNLNLPQGYKESIRMWARNLKADMLKS